jgi:hypothetical protein
MPSAGEKENLTCTMTLHVAAAATMKRFVVTRARRSLSSLIDEETEFRNCPLSLLKIAFEFAAREGLSNMNR